MPFSLPPRDVPPLAPLTLDAAVADSEDEEDAVADSLTAAVADTVAEADPVALAEALAAVADSLGLSRR